MKDPLRILFICSKNEWRSRTAETIFGNRAQWLVKSAGTSRTARIRVNGDLIAWADTIFVMEKKHRQRLQQDYGPLLTDKRLIVLDILDEYPYMNPALIAELEDGVAFHLG